MYTSFYQLDCKPFAHHVDLAQFYWESREQVEALSVMQRGMLHNRKFLYLKGEPGTGKTALVNRLTVSLEDDVICAVIDEPNLDRLEFYNDIAGTFGLGRQITSKVQFLIRFSHFLYQTHEQHKKILLVIDECHHLSQELLEELWLVSNIEKGGVRLLNIYFAGQRLFDDLLSKPHNSAVRQRITRNVELHPLDENGTADYIGHRMRAAGAAESIFMGPAIKTIHQFCQGNMNHINVLCDQALSAGAVQEKRTVDPALVDLCAGKMGMERQDGGGDNEHRAAEITDVSVLPPPASLPCQPADMELESSAPDGAKERNWLRYSAALLALGVLAGGGYLWWSSGQPGKTAGVSTISGVEVLSKHQTPADGIAEKEKVSSEPAASGQQPAEPMPAVSGGSAVTGGDPAGPPADEGRADSLPAETVARVNDPDEFEQPEIDGTPPDASEGNAVRGEGPAKLPAPEGAAGSLPAQSEIDTADTGSAEHRQETEPGAVRTEADGGSSEAVSGGDRGQVAAKPDGLGKEGALRAVDAEQPAAGEGAVLNEKQTKSAGEEVGSAEKMELPADAVAPPAGTAETKTGLHEEKPPEMSVTAGLPGGAEVQPPQVADSITAKKVILGLRSNSLELTAEGLRELDGFVETLQQYPRATLLVKGFVSSKSNSPENILLSEDRAKSVEKLLLERGIEGAKIEARGMGNLEPIASNDTSEGRRQNRRVEIIVIDDGL